MNFPLFNNKDEPQEKPLSLENPAEKELRLLEARFRELGSVPFKLKKSRLINGHNGDTVFEIEGKHEVVKQFQKEIGMKLVTDLENYPRHVKEFIGLLEANTVAVFDVDGTLYIEVNMAVLQSLETFQAFLLFYRSAISKFTEITPFTDLYEQTQSCVIIATKAKPAHLDSVTLQNTLTLESPYKVWVPMHFYVTIKLQDLIIQQLQAHFSTDDYSPGFGIDFLIEHGYEKENIIAALDISRATFFNHMAKLKKTNDNAKATETETTSNSERLTIRREKSVVLNEVSNIIKEEIGSKNDSLMIRQSKKALQSREQTTDLAVRS
jgi:hypothetical protein